MKKTIIAALSIIVLSACTDTKKELVGSWLEVMPPDMNYVQGMTLNENGSASSIGMATLGYYDWKVDGKTFMISGQSIGNGQSINFVDTLEIAKISADSLILECEEYTIKYYKKK